MNDTTDRLAFVAAAITQLASSHMARDIKGTLAYNGWIDLARSIEAMAMAMRAEEVLRDMEPRSPWIKPE